MAGRRQHYIPQFLQRGFLDPGLQGAERTWLHRRSAEPKPVGIRDTGVSEYFYSRPVSGELALDDLITQLEHDVTPTIERFRNTQVGLPLDTDEAALVVHHLIWRTDHIRSVIADAAGQFFETVEDLLLEPDRMSDLVGLHDVQPSNILTEAIERSLTESMPAGVPPELARRILGFLMREKAPELLRQFGQSSLADLIGLGATFNKRAQEAHNEFLSSNRDDDARRQLMASFDWTISEAENLILPDPVGLAFKPDGQFVPVMFASAEETAGIALPISSTRMLVGTADGYSVPNFSDFNSRAAACCQSFFIAAKPATVGDYSDLIGQASRTEIADAIASAWSNIGSSSIARTDYGLPMLAGDGENFSYVLNCPQFDDPVVTRNIRGIVENLIEFFSKRAPLSGLDGITITMEYSQALADLDRGGDLPPLTTTQLGYGIGAAQTATVIREARVKSHIVMDARIAVSWLQDDDNVASGALLIFIKMLAQAAHDTRYADQLGNAFIEEDVMAMEFHSAVASSPRGWFSASYGAFVHAAAGLDYADLTIDSLRAAREATTAAHLAYNASGDIEPLAVTSVEWSSAVLSHAADWLGHREGLPDGSSFAGDDLPERLAEFGLQDWIELFGRDLATIYKTSDGRLNLERASNMSPHVERVLLALGVLVWPDSGSIRWLPFDAAQLSL